MRRLAALLRVRRQQRTLRMAGAVLALAAVLPSAFPYDHVLPGTGDAHAAGHAHEAQRSRDAHAQHCHGDAASCTDAPATGPVQMIGADLLAAAPASLPVPLLAPARALSGIAPLPEVRPPMRALSLPA